MQLLYQFDLRGEDDAPQIRAGLEDSSEPKWRLYDEWMKKKTQKREGSS